MSRSSSRLTRGLRSTPRTSVKIAALAPMPSASVRITMSASPCVRMSEWKATLRTRRNDMLLTPSCGWKEHHIVNHLVCDVFVRDARFQDAYVANSDTKCSPTAALRVHSYGSHVTTQARREAEWVRAESRQKSGRWKKAGSSERRRARRSGEAARRVTWPNLRPGRGDLP